jgi:hypothetical protein
MPTTIRNLDILFNDGTTQSTASFSVPSSFGAVGTVTMALIQYTSTNQTIAAGDTYAGSALLRQVDAANNYGSVQYLHGLYNDNANPTVYGTSYYSLSTTSLSLSGTWRVLTRSKYAWLDAAAGFQALVLVQRIS